MIEDMVKNLKEQLDKTFHPMKFSSKRTVAKVQSDLGWTFSLYTARYCQAIQDANKDKRVAWCQKCLDDKVKFNHLIVSQMSQPFSWKATEEILPEGE